MKIKVSSIIAGYEGTEGIKERVDAMITAGNAMACTVDKIMLSDEEFAEFIREMNFNLTDKAIFYSGVNIVNEK